MLMLGLCGHGHVSIKVFPARLPMSELDVAKEQIAYLKVWLGILVVTDISLVGWLASNIATAKALLLFTGILAVVVTTAGVMLIHRRIEQRIESLRGL
jgi:hypothetical protein